MNAQDFYVIIPLIIIALAPVAIMITIAIKRYHAVVNAFSLLALIAAFITLFYSSVFIPRQVTPLLIVDNYALFYWGLIFFAAFFVVLLSYRYFKDKGINSEEYYILIFNAVLGSAIIAASNHFISFFLGLELLSVSLYVLIAYPHLSDKPLEAGVKYLILAAASSAFLLYGMALVYADTGSMYFPEIVKALISGTAVSTLSVFGFALMTIGIGFKLAVVPFHLWTPDVYQGAPAPVTGFIATVSKGAVFAFLLRLFYELNLYHYYPLVVIFTVIAIASMFTGNLLALRQKNVKRILAYSSIAHLGYLLVAFLAAGSMGVNAATFYLVAYFITTLGAFGVVTILSTGDHEAEDIDDYRGLYWSRPVTSTIFTAMLFSLAGIPLTAGFIGKYYILFSGVNTALWVLVFALVINSVIGLYYYLRVIVAMYSKQDSEKKVSFTGFTFSSGFALGILTLLLIWFGVAPSGLIGIIKTLVASLS
jgi:NADH-quinone oxidoreductase subunit N